MMHLLAETAADPMISGNWLIGFLGAAGTLLGIILGHQKGKASQSVTLSSPVSEVPTRKVSTPPSWDAHKALMDRVHSLEVITQELRRDMAGQYRELMQAGAAREQSLSDKLDGIARGIHVRIDDILKMKGPTR